MAGLAAIAAASFRDTAVGFRNPTGIALDSAGAVYIASAGDSTIAVFAPGAKGRTPPVRRIRGPVTGLINPQGIAHDSRGRIYTSNERRRIEGQGSVTVYPPDAAGNVAPVRMIMGRRTQLAEPAGIALGPDGRVHVANGSAASIVEFRAGADGDVEPERRLPPLDARGLFGGDDGPTDVAVGEDGSLLLADPDGVTAYLSGGGMRHYAVGEKRGLWGQRLRIAAGRGGEFYVVHRPSGLGPGSSRADSMSAMFPFNRPLAISVYAAPRSGDTVPVRTLAGARADLGPVTGLTVGLDGTMYVVGIGGPKKSPTARIAIYPPKAGGDVPPLRVIEGPQTGLVSPTGIAVDRAGRIYVTNSGMASDSLTLAPAVTVYAPGAAGDATPIRTVTGPATGLSRPAAVTVADDGTLYVANSEVPGDDRGSVTVHAATASGDQPPLDTLIGPGSGLVAPRGLALDPADTLYVIASTGRQVQVNVYPRGARGGTTPVRILKGSDTGLENPHALAVHAGQLYVVNFRSASGINAYGPDLGAVTVHRAGASGNEAPLRIIAGSLTRLNGPGAPAVDRSGNLYVPNRWGTGPGSVTVYAPRADGDVRPLRTIAGPATGLRSPTAVALDRHDTLYVANVGAVTVYAPGASGNVAPMRTIEPP